MSLATPIPQSAADSLIALPVPSVVQIAGRGRGQLTHPLDGRYGPMDTTALRMAVERLIARTDLSGVKYVVGIPEGGMVPGYVFGSATGLPVVFASLWQPLGPGVITFSEDHDPPQVARKYIYGLSPGDHVIIVEDEVTSGGTVINCVRALRAAQIRCDQVAAIYASTS